jgi:hypothetical protein
MLAAAAFVRRAAFKFFFSAVPARRSRTVASPVSAIDWAQIDPAGSDQLFDGRIHLATDRLNVDIRGDFCLDERLLQLFGPRGKLLIMH